MEIENTPLPVKKPRARRKRKERQNPAEGLIAALKFVAHAQSRKGEVSDQFCFIGDKWLAAYNEHMLIATQIEEDLTACPHTYQLLEALQQCENELVISQQSEYEISVVSEPFRASIPCVLDSNLSLPTPDAPVSYGSDFNGLKPALAAACLPLDNEGENQICTHLYLTSDTCVGMNPSFVVEAKHSYQLPSVFIHKSVGVLLSKIDKNIIGFGCSEQSITFYFDDNSFIVAKKGTVEYPLSWRDVLNNEYNFWPVPINFFKAVKSVAKFSEDGTVFFDDNRVNSNQSNFEVLGVPNGIGFEAKYLLAIDEICEEIAFDTENNLCVFYGDNVRGIIMGLSDPEINIIEE